MTARVGVIGGGQIGAGWARLLEGAGYAVRVYDDDPGRCHHANSLVAAVDGADVVIEAVVERLDVKRLVLSQIADAVPADTLLVSSSSSFLPTLLQAGVRGPERCLVLHPLHPVDLLPVIEVVPGTQTTDDCVVRAVGWLRALGKTPVVLRQEVQGYVINRLVAALWREAVDLVLKGVIDPEQLDIAAARGPCLGWAVQGPFLTYHLASPAGFGAFWQHVGPAFADIWGSLSTWTVLDDGQADRLTNYVEQTYGGADRSALERMRDEQLRLVVVALQAGTLCKDGVEWPPFDG